MKKLLLLLFVGSLVVSFSGLVLAEDDPDYGILQEFMEKYNEHVNDDGVNDDIKVNTRDFENVPDMNRDTGDVHYDTSGNSQQSVTVDIPAMAYIPSYLELEVTGNNGNAIAMSYGPDTDAIARINNEFYMVFDNEFGGYVDESWNSLGHGRNAEIKPEDGVYIQACDLFRVNIYSNADYNYEIQGGPLSSSRGELPLQMRTKLDDADWGDTVELKDTEIIVTKGATEYTEAYHQFRVPYNRNVANGRYTGRVVFKAYTF